MSPWFNTYGLPQQGQARIFAFPYSGAGASVFYQWSEHCQSGDADFIGVQLPGRENRLSEKPFSDLAFLIEQLVPAIKPWLDKPFVFFGHSFGALIVFELCRALRRQGLPLPKHLFISAFRSPERPNPNRALHALPKAEIIKELRAYAGTPEEVLADSQLMDLFLPLLRADFSVHETYQYQAEAPLSCPISTFSGANDSIVKSESMMYWQQHTTNRFHHRQYPGNHFFVNQQYESVIKQLHQALL